MTALVNRPSAFEVESASKGSGPLSQRAERT